MTIKGSKLALLLLLVVALEILLFEGSDAKRLRLRLRLPFKRRRRSISSPPSPSRVNDWRQDANTICPTGCSISRWQSEYKNSLGDRIHSFQCKKGPFDYKDKHCSTKPFPFRCSPNEFIAGVESTYSASRGVRRFSFRCCHKNGFEYDVDTCTDTDYLIRWYAPMSFVVRNELYLVGVSIEPSNQGNKWYFQTCAFKKAANMDESLSQFQSQTEAC